MTLYSLQTSLRNEEHLLHAQIGESNKSVTRQRIARLMDLIEKEMRPVGSCGYCGSELHTEEQHRKMNCE